MRLLLDVVCIFPHFSYSTFFAITQSAEKPYPACVCGTFLTRSPSIIYTSAPPLRPTATTTPKKQQVTRQRINITFRTMYVVRNLVSNYFANDDFPLAP